ncbi:TorF family putative porin [Fontimonas sp. SYSU GA230001]|uniref:TorF family putative porin n=1 Tax=Fontimonas sp. SYSU GA230001 TaxID=3142450 RepID=UPI0032B38A85
MTFKRSVWGTAVLGAALFSGSAAAGVSVNVGAVSEYMFRGIAQTGGAAVQGGIDYAHDSGVYFGTWASNIGFGGGTEQDLYVGFSKAFGDVSFDVHSTYYWYPEEDEDGSDLSTLEFAVGVGYGPVSLSYAYAPENNFFIGDGDGKEAGYLSLSGSFPITDKLSFDASVGYYHGKEIERFLAGIGSSDDTYMDYMLGLSATLDGGFTMSLQYIATDIDAGTNDDPKFVVGLKKSFDL